MTNTFDLLGIRSAESCFISHCEVTYSLICLRMSLPSKNGERRTKNASLYYPHLLRLPPALLPNPRPLAPCPLVSSPLSSPKEVVSQYLPIETRSALRYYFFGLRPLVQSEGRATSKSKWTQDPSTLTTTYRRDNPPQREKPAKRFLLQTKEPASERSKTITHSPLQLFYSIASTTLFPSSSPLPHRIPFPCISPLSIAIPNSPDSSAFDTHFDGATTKDSSLSTRNELFEPHFIFF